MVVTRGRRRQPAVGTQRRKWLAVGGEAAVAGSVPCRPDLAADSREAEEEAAISGGRRSGEAALAGDWKAEEEATGGGRYLRVESEAAVGPDQLSALHAALNVVWRNRSGHHECGGGLLPLVSVGTGPTPKRGGGSRHSTPGATRSGKCHVGQEWNPPKVFYSRPVTGD
uniref:Uncharacterized protein n=1 Tax=Oryza sativa subsp. japonica TaxID=39947 RepID=Q75GK5_ORYSJ|nr:hypothetical protein [Oryza sativa Japonica Group]